MNCNSTIPSVVSELANQQQLQYLAANHQQNSPSNLEQSIYQHQANHQILNMLAKFRSSSTGALQSSNSSTKSNKNLTVFQKASHNQTYNPNNPTHLFQTLLAVNILRSNIQNSTTINANCINFAPLTLNNVSMAVNLAPGEMSKREDSQDSAFTNESDRKQRFDYSKLVQECTKKSKSAGVKCYQATPDKTNNVGIDGQLQMLKFNLKNGNK
jgi:hypothetical protein